MLNELVTWVLNTYLGKYLENFNPEQLSVALLSGEVELENVPIRKDALCALGIPIQAFSGNIGKIKLQVPVRNFRTASWCVTIEHVYAVFGPKDLNDWNDEKERSSDFAYKMAELNGREAQWRSSKGMPTADTYYSSSYSNWLNCGTSLATNILENLELKLHDVHLRYEDNINVSCSGIAAGIKIAALTMQTCDENWQCKAQWANSQDGLSFKLIELREFAVYWDRMTMEQECKQLMHKELLLNMNERCPAEDHRYLISPINARAQCKRERCKQAIRNKNRPRMSCQILIPAVKLSVSDMQYEQIIECIAGLKYISMIRSYRVRRPMTKISGGLCGDWWRYAAQCHGYGVRSTDDHLNVALENVRYMRIYRRVLENPNANLAKDESEFKLLLEQKRDISELQLMRDVCCQFILMKNQSKARSADGGEGRGGRSMLFHWFPNWLGWYSNGQTIDQSVIGAGATSTLTPTLDHALLEDGTATITTVGGTPTTPIQTGATSAIVNHSSGSTSTTPLTAYSDNTSTNSNNSNSNNSSSNYNTTLMDLDYQNIENDLLNALENSVENDSFSKRDAVFGYLTFILVNGQFIITSESNSSSRPITKMEMDFQQLTSVIEIKPRLSNYTIAISMGSVCLRDMITNGTKFPYLIRPQADNSNTNTESYTSTTTTIIAATNNEPWFQLEYEKGPLDISSDVRLVVKSRSLDIVYNKQAFDWLAQFITKPIVKYEDKYYDRNISKQYHKHQQQPLSFSSVAPPPTPTMSGGGGATADEQDGPGRLRFLQSFKQLLIGNKMQQRKSWSYEIDISAPQIIFVENFLQKQTTIVLVDFGRFQLMKNKSRRKDSMSISVASSTSATTLDFGKKFVHLSRAHNLENIDENSCYDMQNDVDDERTTIYDVHDKTTGDDDDNDDQFMTPCETPPGSEISLSDSPTNSSRVTNFLDDEMQHQTLINEQLAEAENSRLENAFHNRLYDKYSIDLTDMQILICRVTLLEKAGNVQMRIQTNANCHLLDRFNITLRVERRVLYTVDPEYPPLTVLATLPKLVAHIDEQNINTFLKIVYPLLTTSHNIRTSSGVPKSDEPKVDFKSSTNTLKTDFHGSNNLQAEPSAGSEVDINSNLIVGQFHIGLMILEMKSLKKSIAEMQIHGINVGITRRLIDTHLNMSVHGLLLVDAIQSFGPDFELLVASHRHVGMDSVSGSLRRSEPCSPNTSESPDPMGNYRPMSPRTINQAVHSLHSTQGEFHFNSENTPALITVEINYVQASLDEDPITFATINFYNLDVIANQETIVELLGFFNHILCTMEYYRTKYHSESESKSPTHGNNAKKRQEKQAMSINEGEDDNIQEGMKKSQRIEISFEFHRLNVLVMRTIKYEQQNFVAGRKVGTLTMTEAKIDATLGDDREMSISGSLGGIQIIDITPEGINHQRIFSVGKDPLTDPPSMSRILALQHGLLSTLTNEVYGRAHQSHYSTSTSYDISSNALMFQISRQGQHDAVCLKIRMASVWYTHCPRFIHEISECISQFKHYLKGFVRSVRKKATNIAMEFVHSSNEFPNEMNFDESTQHSIGFDMKNPKPRTGQLSLDIILESPVIVLPRSSTSTDVFVANLGEISVFTHEQECQYHEAADVVNVSMKCLTRRTRNRYYIKVRNINLFSLNTLHRKDIKIGALPRAHEFYSCTKEAQPILHDTALCFTFIKDTTKTMERDKCRYETMLTVDGSVTELLQVSLTRAQYKQLTESLENAAQCADLKNDATTLKRDSDVVTQLTQIDENDGNVLHMQEASTAEVVVTKDDTTKQDEDLTIKKQRIHLGTRLKFSVPELKMHLKNDNEHDLMGISFSEFSIQYNILNMEKNVEILLRSIIVDDLKVNPRSRFRHMIDSTSVNTHNNDNGNEDNNDVDKIFAYDEEEFMRETPQRRRRRGRTCSHSCPYTHKALTSSISFPNVRGNGLPLHKCCLYSSLPDHLDVTAGAAANKNMHVCSIDDNDFIIDPDISLGPCNFENFPQTTTNMDRKIDKNLVIYKAHIVDINDQESSTESSIDFNCLNLTLSVERWFTVLDFFGFIESSREKQVRGTSSKIQTETVHRHYSSKLKVTVRALNLILVRNESELARANISSVYLKICQGDIVNAVEGRLGSISLYDLTNFGYLYREKFSTSGPEALNFHYKRLRSNDKCAADERSLEKDSVLTLQMSSVRYIHTKRFLSEVHIFVNELLQLQTPVIKHMQVSEIEPSAALTRPLQIGLEIHAAAPIILLPMSHESCQLIIADLGKLTVRNAFHLANDSANIISRWKSSKQPSSSHNTTLDSNQDDDENNETPTVDVENIEEQNQSNENEEEFVEILDVMHVDLLNINLFAGEWQTKANINVMRRKMTTNATAINYEPCLYIGDYVILKKGHSLFEEPCYLKLQIERNTDAQVSHQCADLSVQGTLSKLNGVIHLQQYRLIRGFLIYNLGEDISDVYNKGVFDLHQSMEKLNLLHPSTTTQDEVVDAVDDTTAVWKTMSISLLLENVSLLIALEQTTASSQQKREDTNEMNLKPLACIKFIKSALEIDNYSDGAQDIDLISSEILLLDSRKNNDANNVFKYILQPMQMKSNDSNGNIVQAEIHSRRRANHSKYTILLNNMRIMAILDCMECLKNFLQSEPHMPAKLLPKTKIPNLPHVPTIKTPIILETTTNNNIIDESTLEIVLNITNSELVFAEKLSQFDTNAIILRSTTVFSYKLDRQYTGAPISVDINHLEVFSCILGEEERSALSIIDPFTLNIELKEHRLNMLIPKQLCVRLSYNDVKLFSRMLQSVPQQTHKKIQNQQINNYNNGSLRKHKTKTLSNVELIAPLIAMGFSSHESWEAMQQHNYQLNDSANYLLQQQRLRQQTPREESDLTIHELELSADRIYCCIIDDCMDADVPLLECSFAQLKYTQQLKRLPPNEHVSGLQAQLSTVYACDYYNRRLSGWEPIIESWPCTATWLLEGRQKLQVYIQSKHLLRFNVTTTLIELCEMVRKNWTQDYYNNDQQRLRRTPFVPFALQNHTGEPLLFKTIFAQPGGLMRQEITQQDMMYNWVAVDPMEVVNFDFGPQTKLRHMDSHKLNVHQMLVQIKGWNLIGPISIDKVGVYFRNTTRDQSYLQRTRIVFDICLEGSAQKLITVMSALNVINKLDRELMLKTEVRPGEHNEWCQVLAPHQSLTIPLRHVDNLLFLKPHGPGSMEHNARETSEEARIMANMGYCSRGIAWQECSKEPLQELYTCYGQHKQLFHMVVEVRPDKYAMREKNSLPGHTISVLAPLKLRNLLCCELIYCLEDQLKGRVLAGSTAYIYDVNMQQSINLSLTLDNYQVSGQLKIPLGHCGVVEPKLKLIDVNNRELLLRVSIQHLPGNGMEIFVSAPTWLINKTGLPLMFRQEGTGHLASGQFEEHETARVVTPLLFSFSDQEGSPALEMRLGQRYGENNQWCKSFNVHKEIAFRELRAENCKGCFAVGINVRRGRGIYACTTFITLSPRFQLYNRTKHRLELAQKCDVINNDASVGDNFIEALQDSNFPFHWPNCEQEPLLCIRILDIANCDWSHGIPINEAQSLYLNIRNGDGDMWFLRLEVISRQATFLLLFTDAKLLPPPIRIDNYSEVQVTFNQSNSRPYWNTPVRPQSSLAYALDNPMGTQSLQIEAPDGNVIEYALNRIDLSRSLTYANFIYIAFKETFASNENAMVEGIEPQQLVLDVRDKRVILTRKRSGDRSQLWLMNSNGQLEHEGSSPPAEYSRQTRRTNRVYSPRMVLDLETAPKPMDATSLVIRPPNKQRVTTQTWRFVNGRLMCYANMCVQPKNGIYGLCEGTEAVLARITQPTGDVPYEQAIEIQKLRPGSGHLEVSGKMDGPIFTIQIRDIKAGVGETPMTNGVVFTGLGYAKNADDVTLLPDPQWQHASMQRQTNTVTNCVPPNFVIGARNDIIPDAVWFNECNINFLLEKGVGLSVVTRLPGEELAYISLEDIAVHALITPRVKTLDLCVQDLQIDNQLLDTPCPVLLHTINRPQQQQTSLPSSNDNKIDGQDYMDDVELTSYSQQQPQQELQLWKKATTSSSSIGSKTAALSVRAKMLTSPNRNAVLFEYLHIELSPCAVYLEERLILKTAIFLGFGQLTNDDTTTVDASLNNILCETQQQQQHQFADINIDDLTRNAVRYYFESLSLGPTQIRLSVLTASKLTNALLEVKKALGLTLIKFEDALIEFDSFSVRNQFKTSDLYVKALRTHYINQLKWHAAAILGSVDFLGNPWGFANDLSEGVSSLIFEGSVKSLVKNVTHGISNSTAKLTETLSDSLGRVVLDEHDNETRQKILELQVNTSGGHLAAGLKGLGFGLLGGVTSIVHYTYMGAVSDGFPGFLSGLGKGLVGTVTKPLIGVLDLASETANAVRETSKNSNRSMPARKRLSRCVTGAPGGLLPNYSYRQAKGQQYLYVINRRNFGEKLMFYEPNLCNDKETKLRLLISTEYIRIFSRCEEDPTLMLECHLAEVLACHPVAANVIAPNPITAGTTTPPMNNEQQQQQQQQQQQSLVRLTPSYYIEISINLPKITRPRVRCQNEATAERAARAINYAKSVFDERVQSVTLD